MGLKLLHRLYPRCRSPAQVESRIYLLKNTCPITSSKNRAPSGTVNRKPWPRCARSEIGGNCVLGGTWQRTHSPSLCRNSIHNSIVVPLAQATGLGRSDPIKVAGRSRRVGIGEFKQAVSPV